MDIPSSFKRTRDIGLFIDIFMGGSIVHFLHFTRIALLYCTLYLLLHFIVIIASLLCIKFIFLFVQHLLMEYHVHILFIGLYVFIIKKISFTYYSHLFSFISLSTYYNFFHPLTCSSFVLYVILYMGDLLSLPFSMVLFLLSFVFYQPLFVHLIAQLVSPICLCPLVIVCSALPHCLIVYFFFKVALLIILEGQRMRPWCVRSCR